MPLVGGFGCLELVLYDIRIVCFHAQKESIIGALMPKRTRKRKEMPLVGGFRCLELVLYGIRVLAEQHYEPLDQ